MGVEGCPASLCDVRLPGLSGSLQCDVFGPGSTSSENMNIAPVVGVRQGCHRGKRQTERGTVERKRKTEQKQTEERREMDEWVRSFLRQLRAKMRPGDVMKYSGPTGTVW